MFDLKYFNLKAEAYPSGFFIAGCDEVGRGPLAGPVVAACASIEIKIFDIKEIRSLLRKWSKLGITDSKLLTAEARAEILKKISVDAIGVDQILSLSHSENIQIKILIKEIHAPKIDEINILQASLEAMKLAMVESCPVHLPGMILIDGNKKLKYSHELHEQEAVVKGDSKSLLIGLASIAAKVYRDQLMKDLSEKYPGYGWEQNAGYPTKKHIEAIGLLGVTELHRLTFSGVKEVYAERGYSRIESI
ncbi:ribonuclease HII [Bacteriovorax sp. PP10]|uniref:Ribonuclease n=1 Tax=Bacteriovorax antarcticus TaxID=3088717 RepID=A0ABU5VZU5_9BACT|nr:ribonuclease HII [Bacteriovorax sp. PP10]MEA9358600.1 ribonuclease HII [Bacteriovorax sp. PP10]